MLTDQVRLLKAKCITIGIDFEVFANFVVAIFYFLFLADDHLLIIRCDYGINCYCSIVIPVSFAKMVKYN